MKALLSTVAAGLCLALLPGVVGDPGHGVGIIGYGQWWYDPTCAWSCRAVIGRAPLDCPHDLMDDDTMGMSMDMHGGPPNTACIAQNFAFLSTLATCLAARCPADGVSVSRLETYWAEQATGDRSVPPKWTYGAMLTRITEKPTREYQRGDTLNYTAIISDAAYGYQYTFNRHFDWEEMVQSNYVLVIISIGVASPLFLALASRLPVVHQLVDKAKPYLVYPSMIGSYNMQPLPFLLGNAPTMGQGLWIAMFVLLNIILGAITYQNMSIPHPWGYTKTGEMLSYVGYRTGHISLALLPLTLLFSSRNNFLQWLTGWSFSTFIVLHRWVARLCALHAVVHSITLLGAYIDLGAYAADVHKPYWIWGIIGTLCLVLLLVHSALWFRRASYEVFLILHVLFAVFAIAGCWYHLYYWKPFSGIYELWLYMACAVWFFDRAARVFRVATNGVCRAEVTEITADIVRVDVPGVRWAPGHPGRHAFVYFPTLQPLRAWENHPFSVIHSSVLNSTTGNGRFSTSSDGHHIGQDAHLSDAEKNGSSTVAVTPGNQTTVSRHASAPMTTGVSFYVKKHTGITQLLRARKDLPILLDGPYSTSSSSKRDVLRCDRVLLIGGGIGITGLLAWTSCAHLNVRLAWSIKQGAAPLAESLSGALEELTEKTVLIRQRIDVEGLLGEEVAAGWERIGVVVCGPASLCDDVRAAVVRVARSTNVVFELEVDSFGW